MTSFEVLKNRLNEVYRSNALLEAYQNNLLKNSELKPEHLQQITAAKEQSITLAQEILNTIGTLTQKQYNVASFTQPLEWAFDLMKSEHFFETRELIDGLLAIYEKNFSILANQFMISPLDKLRFYKMQFV